MIKEIINEDEGIIIQDELRTILLSGILLEEVTFHVPAHIQMRDNIVFGEI